MTQFPRSLIVLLTLSVFLLAGGCTSYHTPGRAADLAVFGDAKVRDAYARKPVAPMPARIAVVRVQESGYRSHSVGSYGRGAYSVVTARDVETDDDFRRLGKMSDVAGLVPLNRLLINQQLDTDEDLRQAAASLQTDMLLIYTFDTAFSVEDAMRPLNVVTLGLFPTQNARVTTTASALLVDVRTGYIYATAEATSRNAALANSWTSDDAVDKSRRETERSAFVDLVGEFEHVWPRVAAERKAALSRR